MEQGQTSAVEVPRLSRVRQLGHIAVDMLIAPVLVFGAVELTGVPLDTGIARTIAGLGSVVSVRAGMERRKRTA